MPKGEQLWFAKHCVKGFYTVYMSVTARIWALIKSRSVLSWKVSGRGYKEVTFKVSSWKKFSF